MTDHYKTLGIKHDASLEDIKKAYRTLSRKYHPDNTNGDSFFVNMFKQIQEAYEVLGSIEKKAKYDKEFKAPSFQKKTYRSYSEFDPEISYFQSDKAQFYSGNELRFEWKTLNADVIEIKPFGIVKAYGNTTFKLNNINKQYVTVELIATNTSLSKHVSKKLILENKLFKGVQSKSVFKKDISRVQKQSHSRTKTNKTESFLSINGRLRRRDYLIRLIILSIPSVLLLEVSNASTNDGLILLLFFTSTASWILLVMQTIKRIHDINKSGWWYLLFLAPFANIVFGLYLLFTDGTRGKNKYGNDPKNQ